MKRLTLLATFAATSAMGEPKRINKAIELLAEGQPVYYTTSRGGHAEGKELARTWADYINYELEHGAFDVARLRDFMQGLVEGGPTASGHRTPAVIATLPALGLDEAAVRANHWIVQQVLATGVHGVVLCHARTPGAVQAFVEAARYPFHLRAVGEGLGEGLRGSGSQGFASGIWGVSGDEYLRVADPWPLNPDGEILLGLKVEDRHALANAEESTRVPGIGFAEWGPGDMAFSYGIARREPGPLPDILRQARARVLSATRSANIAFLNAVHVDDVEAMIDEGVRIGAAADEETAMRGRRYTKRRMPW